MRTLTQQLTQYAAYHRDRRNIATHFIGIPMIVLALAVLLSRPVFALTAPPLILSPAGCCSRRPRSITWCSTSLWVC